MIGKAELYLQSYAGSLLTAGAYLDYKGEMAIAQQRIRPIALFFALFLLYMAVVPATGIILTAARAIYLILYKFIWPYNPKGNTSGLNP